jgi:hypothetical protein
MPKIATRGKKDWLSNHVFEIERLANPERLLEHYFFVAPLKIKGQLDLHNGTDLQCTISPGARSVKL